MCLSEISKKKIANKDIVCYKILVKNLNGEYCAPYYNDFKYEIGKEYDSELVVTVTPCFTCVNSIITYYTENKVEKGLHSFRNKNHALAVSYWIPGGEKIVAKFIIPKGSEYYTGIFWGHFCYASNKIKFDKIVYENG